jgi:hypothetical protein
MVFLGRTAFALSPVVILLPQILLLTILRRLGWSTPSEVAPRVYE